MTTDQRLVTFDTDRSGRTRGSVAVRGLASGDRLVGIDYRVQNSKLYGVGRAGGVYTLAQDGRATKVSQLSVDLQGTASGVDFNPAADRLRVVSSTGQNLRHDVNTLLGPTAVDGTLTYPATPTAPAATATGVTGAAYTNNDLDPDTATTLYDIDTALDQVVLQSPANAGLLAATGKLRADAVGDAGFDIYSTVRGGRTVDLTAFATLKVGGTYRLYAITLFNGGARSVGSFPSGQQVTDLAIPLNQR